MDIEKIKKIAKVIAVIVALLGLCICAIKYMGIEEIKTTSAVIVAIVTLIGLFKGVIEFSLQGAQKRAEIFLKKQGEYFANESFNKIRYLLDQDLNDDPDDIQLEKISFEEKRAYLTFFEEIAILKNTGLIKSDLAYYMYGYYATRCKNSTHFWTCIDGYTTTDRDSTIDEDSKFSMKKDSIFWNVFNRFADEMENRLEVEKEIVRHDIKF